MNKSLSLFGFWLIAWATSAVNAVVAMKGWEWFVVDTFGAMPLGFFQVWGIVMFVSFVTAQTPPQEGYDRKYVIAYSLALSFITWVDMLILSNFVG